MAAILVEAGQAVVVIQINAPSSVLQGRALSQELRGEDPLHCRARPRSIAGIFLPFDRPHLELLEIP